MFPGVLGLDALVGPSPARIGTVTKSHGEKLRIVLARFCTGTHGRSRKRLLLTTRCRFRLRVASSHFDPPVSTAIRHAGLDNGRGFSSPSFRNH